MNKFYMLISTFMKTHEATTAETENRKTKIMNNVKQL